MSARLISARPLRKTRRFQIVARPSSWYSTIAKCPPPSCSCSFTPPNLAIDHTRALSGTAPTYAQHVMICTGKRDWTSRIEDDGEGTGWGELGRKLRSMLTRGGEFADPYNNVLISNISFKADSNSTLQEPGASAIVWSHDLGLRYFQDIVVNDENVQGFIQTQLLPQNLHPAHDGLSKAQKHHWTRESAGDTLRATAHASREPIVLICGHGGRDERCGILGPLLQDEMSRTITASKILKDAQLSFSRASFDGYSNGLKVGLCSHIGGHRFAGNMIIYFPRQYGLSPDTAGHPLQGCGVWYGRVEPKHVEGILDRTIREGQIIEELVRGIQPGLAAKL